eukprot:TRINITY_DN11546_c0_g1_i1.p1 TRINITY_DN11546_c0_g1~~TRINITY_DN11546_c0_g1_i1.p1  ORF type:complete len:395 (-),score=71.26 TRINITY_DN11546_c0_g1_i1:8-1123(-)
MCDGMFDTTSSSCRAQSDLCSADPNFAFDDDWSNLIPGSEHVIIDASGFQGFHWATPDTAPPLSTRMPTSRLLPLQLQAADLDLNGYPDLLLPLQVDGAKSASRVMQLWRNVECSSSTCYDAAVHARRRTFTPVAASDPTFSVLQNVQNPFVGAFFDYDEEGSMGLLFNTYSPSDGTYSIVTLYNNIDVDALFLKTLGLNGVCPSWCPVPPWSSTFPDPKPYGANQAGVTFKFTVSDLDGVKKARVGAQLWHTSYFSLQTPYNHYGLGRTNNYIEEFFVGFTTSSQSESHFFKWICIIPNSQLIVFPYPAGSPSEWTLELLISPSRNLLSVAIFICSALAITAAITFYFHYQEKKADETEKQKSEHFVFTF